MRVEPMSLGPALSRVVRSLRPDPTRYLTADTFQGWRKKDANGPVMEDFETLIVGFRDAERPEMCRLVSLRWASGARGEVDVVAMRNRWDRKKGEWVFRRVKRTTFSAEKVVFRTQLLLRRMLKAIEQEGSLRNDLDDPAIEAAVRAVSGSINHCEDPAVLICEVAERFEMDPSDLAGVVSRLRILKS